MVQTRRQNHARAHVVNLGVALDGQMGSVAAWVFLTRQGIDQDTIERVLGSPERRRAAADERAPESIGHAGQSIGQNQTSSDAQ